MPVIKTVSVNYERKINLGDFNSATIGCTLWADVREEEDLNQVMQDLWDCAKANVKAQAVPLVQKNGAALSIKEAFLGLPIEAKGGQE
jgi:hypothetical protein